MFMLRNKFRVTTIRLQVHFFHPSLLVIQKYLSGHDQNVSNGIPYFEAFLRKSIYSFTTRLSSSSNKLICAIEQSWIMKSVIWKTWEEKMYI